MRVTHSGRTNKIKMTSNKKRATQAGFFFSPLNNNFILDRDISSRPDGYVGGLLFLLFSLDLSPQKEGPLIHLDLDRLIREKRFGGDQCPDFGRQGGFTGHIGRGARKVLTQTSRQDKKKKEEKKVPSYTVEKNRTGRGRDNEITESDLSYGGGPAVLLPPVMS